jgi:single-stranded DNA-binding protein
MNTCILMAEIIQAPQLRYTSESQTPVTEMMVQFPGSRPEDPPAMLKVVGWGNLAQDMQEHYHVGDRIVIEGRLSMSTVDRPEGFKEKRAELTAQRIYQLAADALESRAPLPSAEAAAPVPTQSATTSTTKRKSPSVKADTGKFTSTAMPEPNLDDIPF